MSPVSDLPSLLREMRPELRPGEFVFATVAEAPPQRAIHASVVEAEGLSVVLERTNADALGLDYDYVAAWITLRVSSALEAVGLTAAVSTALANAGISCNVIAGHHHDHLLVPAERAADALNTLAAIAATEA